MWPLESFSLEQDAALSDNRDRLKSNLVIIIIITRMRGKAQPDGRPAI